MSPQNDNANLPAPSRAKLGSVLARLGSDDPGERDAAARAAHQIVTRAGLTWTQLLSLVPARMRVPEYGVWRTTAAECLSLPGSLRPWEAAFLHDLSGFRRLSTKQRYVLKEIADRVLQREWTQ